MMMCTVKRPKRRGRGFSVLEVMVVLGILAIVVGIAIPMFSSTREANGLRDAARRLAGNFKRAQALARSGKADVPTWAPGTRVRMAGIRFISPTQYAIFVDNDRLANGGGTEVDVEIVDIAPRGEPYTFVGAPAEVRFRRNGTLPNAADVPISIQNTSSNVTKVVTVTYGGRASVN